MTRRSAVRRTTIREVASVSGVSVQTVSNVLNAPEKVAPETQERVRSAIAATGYRPNAAARSLRTRRAQAIGLELDVEGARRAGDLLGRFLVELCAAASGHGAHVVPFVADDPQRPDEGYMALVREHVVDGFVLTSTRHADPRPALLHRAEVPFASFGRDWDDPAATNWADVDGQAGVRIAVEHCLARGHRRIAFLGWPEGSPTGDERRQGWRAATGAAGIADDTLQAVVDQDIEQAAAAARRLVDLPHPPDAFVCASDLLALGVRQALGAAPVDSERVAVVGFDDGPLAELHGLTTMRQPVALIAADLVGRISARQAETSEPSLFVPELVIRAT